MVSGMRTGYPRKLNKGLGSKFRGGSRLRQEIPEEGRRAHRPKHCTDNNGDEDNSPNNPNNTNQQASSQKFREIPFIIHFYLGKYSFKFGTFITHLV